MSYLSSTTRTWTNKGSLNGARLRQLVAGADLSSDTNGTFRIYRKSTETDGCLSLVHDGTANMFLVQHNGATGASFNLTASTTTGTVSTWTLGSLTTGVGLSMASVSQALSSGNMFRINETQTAATAARTGASEQIASSRTVATGSISDDFDNLEITRASTKSGGTYNVAGSLLKILNTQSASLDSDAAYLIEAGEVTNVTNNLKNVALISRLCSGNADTAGGFGLGLSFQLTNDASTDEEHASIDILATNGTDGAEETDIVFRQMTGGSVSETLRLVSADTTTTSDTLQFTANTAETNATCDVLKLILDTSGTGANNLGAGILVEIDDAGGVEAQARIDFVMVDATDTSEDCDIVFSQNSEGTVRETLRLNAAHSSTGCDQLQFTANTGETNAVVNFVDLILNCTGTPANGLGGGLRVQMDDAGGIEEQASIDFVMTETTDGQEDVDIVFSQNLYGTITEKFRIDGDGSLWPYPDPTQYVVYHNEFLRTADLDLTNDWTETDEQGTNTVALSDDSRLGGCVITTGGTDNDRVGLQYTGAGGAGEFIRLTAGKATYFETRVQLSDATQLACFVGLCITDITLGEDSCPTATDYVGFAKDDGDTNWDFVTAKDSSEDEGAAIATASTNYVTLQFYCDGVTTITPYVNGVRGTTVTDTNDICDDDDLCITFHLATGETASKVMTVDYVRVVQQR